MMLGMAKKSTLADAGLGAVGIFSPPEPVPGQQQVPGQPDVAVSTSAVLAKGNRPTISGVKGLTQQRATRHAGVAPFPLNLLFLIVGSTHHGRCCVRPVSDLRTSRHAADSVHSNRS